MAKRGMTLIGDFASKKMKEEGIDGEQVAKKALHKTKDFFKGFGRKKRGDTFHGIARCFQSPALPVHPAE